MQAVFTLSLLSKKEERLLAKRRGFPEGNPKA
jgi:hypothetical protein